VESGEVAQEPHRLAAARQTTVLQHDPHGGAVVRAGPPRVGTEDADLAGVRSLQTLGALDGRRLAGTVGPEDCCHLSMTSRPRHTREGSGCAKPLGEVTHGHGLGHGQSLKRVEQPR